MSNTNDPGEAAVPAGYRLGDGWLTTGIGTCKRYATRMCGEPAPFIRDDGFSSCRACAWVVGALVPIEPPVAEPATSKDLVTTTATEDGGRTGEIPRRTLTDETGTGRTPGSAARATDCATSGASSAPGARDQRATAERPSSSPIVPVAEPAQPVCKAWCGRFQTPDEYDARQKAGVVMYGAWGRMDGPPGCTAYDTILCSRAKKPLNPPPAVPPEPAKARKVYDGPVLPGMRFRFANGLHGTVLDVDGPGVRYRTAAGSPEAWCNIDTFRQVATYAPVPPGPVPREGEPVEQCTGCGCCEVDGCDLPHEKCSASICDGDGSTFAERNAPAAAPAKAPLSTRLRASVRSNRMDARGEIERHADEMEAMESQLATAIRERDEQRERADQIASMCSAAEASCENWTSKAIKYAQERNEARAERDALRERLKEGPTLPGFVKTSDVAEAIKESRAEVAQLRAKLLAETSRADLLQRHADDLRARLVGPFAAGWREGAKATRDLHVAHLFKRAHAALAEFFRDRLPLPVCPEGPPAPKTSESPWVPATEAHAPYCQKDKDHKGACAPKPAYAGAGAVASGEYDAEEHAHQVMTALLAEAPQADAGGREGERG